MATLPWDTIVNILSQLPVEDLLRYRCVSKPWCSLIDGPRFIKMHLDHAMETSSNLILIRAGRQLHSVKLDTLDSPVRLIPPVSEAKGMEILGRCNGLLALSNSNGDMAFANPATRKYMKIPTSDVKDHPFGKYEFGLDGFGYDPVNDDYKFLRITHYFGDDRLSFHSEVKVYSLKSNTWKRVSDFPYKFSQRGNGILVGNSLHYIVGLQFPDSSPSCTVIAFDLVTERYREIPLPDNKSNEDKSFYTTVTELGGWLCEVIKYRVGKKLHHVDFWVMKEYGVKESWTKLFSMAPSNETGVFESAMPIAYLKSANQVLLDLDGKKVMLYDLNRKGVKSVRRISGCPECFETFVSVGSLLGFGGDGNKNGKKAGENDDKRKEEEQQVSGKKRDDFLSKGFKLVL